MRGMPEGIYEVFSHRVEYHENEEFGVDTDTGENIRDELIAEFGVYIGPLEGI